MPFTTDPCSPLVAHQVIIGFRDLCLDRNTLDVSALTGTLSLISPTTAPLADANGTFFTNYPVVQTFSASSLETCTANGCDIQAIKTCVIPANIDTAYDPTNPASVNRALTPEGSYYQLSITANCKTVSYPFIIDAAVTYTELCDAIPISAVDIAGNFPPANIDDPFANAICEGLHRFDDNGAVLPAIGKVVQVKPDGSCELVTIPAAAAGTTGTLSIGAADPVTGDVVATFDMGGGAGPQPLTIFGRYVDVDTVTRKYVEGDTLAFPITLPDGSSVLPAGTPVPANTFVVTEEDAAGALVDGKSFYAYGKAETYTAGETAAYDLLLADGSTLTAGSPMPAGSVVIVQENADGTIANQDAFTIGNTGAGGGDTVLWALADNPDGSQSGSITINGTAFPIEIPAPTVPDVDTITGKYTEGDTLAFPVTLPNGAVLTAGQPVPADVLIVTEEDAAGALISVRAFENTHGNSPKTYTEGETAPYDLTLPSGALLAAGTPVPALTVIAVEESPAGLVVSEDAWNISTTAFLRVTNPDGSQTITDTRDGVPNVYTIPGPAAATSNTKPYVEGDTLTYPVTLPDNTVLVAGQPVPPNVLIIAEEDATGGALTHKSYGPTIAVNNTVTYVEGDTAAYNLVLADGSTLTAGTPVPAGNIIIAEQNAAGALLTAKAFAAAPGDIPRHYLAGETAAYDLLLPDGSTLTAGTPVPADTVIAVLESAAGVVLDQDAWSNPTHGFARVTNPDGSQTITDTRDGVAEVYTIPAPAVPDVDTITGKYTEGDTLTFPVTLPDGSTLTAGTPVPAGTLVITEEDTAGALISFKAFAAAPSDIPRHYVAGETAAYDLLLPDGSTLTAGTAVPAGTVIAVLESAAGVVLDQDAWFNPSTAFLRVTNPDGSQTITDTRDGVPNVYTIPGPAAATSNTKSYVEGDTLTYPVTLPDNTVLTAGTPVPANVLIIAEEDATGGALTHTSYGPTIAVNSTVTYVEGDVAAYDLVLADGSTLTAGTAVPAGNIIIAEQNAAGALLTAKSFAAAPSDIPRHYVAGETAAYDLLLPDGSTLTAGTPVPADTVIAVLESAAGVVLDQDAWSNPTHALGRVVNPDGSQTITDTRDGNVVTYTIPAPAAPATTTGKYTEGDTLAFPVLLPDGTTLLTGTPVPANVLIITEEDAAGALLTSKSFAAAPSDIPRHYIPGETAAYDLLLPDGSTLTAGTAVPAGTVIAVLESAAGVVLDQDAWSHPTHAYGAVTNPDGSQTITITLDGAPNVLTIPAPAAADVDTTTEPYKEGDTLAYPVTLNDNTVLTAGTAVPAGVLVVAEEDAAGAVIRYKVFGPTATAGGSTKVFMAGETITEAVTANGVDYAINDIVPDELTIIIEKDAAGNQVEVDWITFATIDLCAALAALPAAACVDGPFDLVTSGCQTVSTNIIVPTHGDAECSAPTETFTTFTGAAAAPTITSSAAGARQQQGAFINIGSNATLEGDVTPYTFTVPAGTAGNTHFIQISWGSDDAQLGGVVNATATGDLANQTLLPCEMTAFVGTISPLGQTVTSRVFAYDITGTGGGSIDFEWPNRETGDTDGYDDIIQVTPLEIGGITTANLDTAGCVVTRAPEVGDNTGTLTEAPGMSTSAPAIDMGATDAVWFGVGRHVAALPAPVSTLDMDSAWATTTNPAVVQNYSMTTYGRFCQIGATGGYIPANSGPVVFTGQSNIVEHSRHMDFMAIPLLATAGVGSTADSVNQCDFAQVNDNCEASERVKVIISANTCITAAPLSNLSVQPVVNGVPINRRFHVDNSSGTDPKSLCIPFETTYRVPTLTAPGDTANVSVTWRATDIAGTFNAANDSITIENPLAIIETNHV